MDIPCTAATRQFSARTDALPLIPQRAVGKLPRAGIALDPAKNALFANVVVTHHDTCQLVVTTGLCSGLLSDPYRRHRHPLLLQGQVREMLRQEPS